MSVYDWSEWNRTSILLLALATTNWERSPQYLQGEKAKVNEVVVDQQRANLLPFLNSPSAQRVASHTQRSEGAGEQRAGLIPARAAGPQGPQAGAEHRCCQQKVWAGCKQQVVTLETTGSEFIQIPA